MSDTAYATQVLRDVPGLWDVEPAALEGLADKFDLVVYKSRQIVCREGEPAETLFLLADGEVEVIKRATNGKLYTVATLTAGCVFGHVGLMTLSRRTASIRAKGRIQVLQMPANRARDLLREGPFEVTSPFRRALIVALSRQVSSATSTVMQLAMDAGVAGRARPDEPPELPEDAIEQLMNANSQV